MTEEFQLVNEIIINLFPREIAHLIILLGFVIFFLCFFGTTEYKRLSEFEKIIFSIFTGLLIWYLFIFPISIGIETLKLYFTYSTESNVYKNSINNFNSFFILILIYFIILRLDSNTPIFYNKNYLKLNITLIEILIFYISCPIFIFILFSFLFSNYQEHATHLTVIIIFIILLLLILYIILLKLSYLHTNFHMDTILKLKRNSIKIFKQNAHTKILIIIFIFIIISGITGIIFYNSHITDEEMKVVWLEIPVLPVEKNSYGNLQGSQQINDQLKLKFGLIKFVEVHKNFTIIKAYDTDDSSKEYDFSGNFVILRGDDEINVTLRGTHELYINKEFYNFTKQNHLNNTQVWNISFQNPYPYKIEVHELEIENPDRLKLIKWTNNGIYMNDGRLNDEVNKSSNELITSISILPTDSDKTKTICLYFTK